jgi:hypothetical protein
VTLLWQGREEREQPLAEDSGIREKAPAEPRFSASRAWRHRFLRWLFNGSVPEPLPSVLGPVEPPIEGKLGICCSGGGIRSAAFCLGALQSLQERGELRRASYLAAVSGGSYIATAISLVNKTGEGGSDPALLERSPPFAPGSPEEQYLRNHCSYLAPTLFDEIYLAWRVVLGLLVNLTLTAIPLAALVLILSGLVYVPSLHELAGACGEQDGGSCAVQTPLWFWLATLGTLGLSLVFGVATLLPRWQNERWEMFFTTWTTRLLLLAGALAVFLFAVPYATELVREGRYLPGTNGKGTGLGAGTLALLVGVATQIADFLTSNRTAAELKEKDFQRFFKALGKGVRSTIAYLAVGLVGPLLLFGVVVLTVAMAMSEAGTTGTVDVGLIEVGAVALVGFSFLYYFFDITNWSLHPYYKRRLSSVFALKRVRPSTLDARERKRFEVLEPANSEADCGVAIERNYDEPVPLSTNALVGGEGSEWPTLLICAAANISDENATPPGRKVTSFTFSAYSVGGPLVGAVRTWELETAFAPLQEAFPNVPPERLQEEEGSRGPLERMVDLLRGASVRRRRRHDLTLASAMAMSGAAVSPSMGKMTKYPLTFLLALANIRLGVWVPNPRWVEELGRRPRLRKHSSRPRPFYLLCELFGLNRIGSKYLYVTDGGHYENLGLVELLRRGCTEVYCLDASGVGAGGEFESLGEAITLARSELGVEIEFDDDDGSTPAEMVPNFVTHFSARDVVTARIKYRGGEEGRLVYVRSALTEGVPWDVLAHHQADPRFPNNPTIDQLYTDQKFEAYRVLGSRAAKRATEAMGVT